MAETMTGGCARGRIRYTARPDSDEAYLCHCRMCQRATGSVSIPFKTLRKADVAWAREPDWYQSSPFARRPFCRECGASLGFQYPESDKTDLTVASFDDPSRFRPTAHFAAESMHCAWIDTSGLPETRSEDYQPLVDRWMNSVGKLPDQT
ncbi:MAG: GFA family protein [Allosphingosinicella sp.]|uniref:GFA family protein n=1 Tax=Allosphingosinicella sp. TaxID=2823234 RepID=UPI00392118F9